MQGISRDIKHIFLSFAQEYFSDSLATSYEWNINPVETEIVIADKYAIDIGVAVKRPSIIVSRGGYGWSDIIRNDGQTTDVFHLEKNVAYGSADRKKNRTYIDLVTGSIVFNVIAKHGVQAEQIADELFYGISAYKWDFKSKGINDIRNLRVSEERILKQTSEIELAVVTVSGNYVAKKAAMLSEKLYNIRVFLKDTHDKKYYEVFEGSEFKVPPTGTGIIFKKAPTNTTSIKVNYVDAITLNQVNDVTPVEGADGARVSFTLPDGGTIYGVYKLLEKMIITDNEIINDEWVQVGE